MPLTAETKAYFFGIGIQIDHAAGERASASGSHTAKRETSTSDESCAKHANLKLYPNNFCSGIAKCQT